MSEQRGAHSRQQPHRRSQQLPDSVPLDGRKLKRPKKEPAAAVVPARAGVRAPSRRLSEAAAAGKKAQLPARRNSKAKAQPKPQPKPQPVASRKQDPPAAGSRKADKAPPPARHNGVRTGRKRGGAAGTARAPGILGLCDSFSSQCDLRGGGRSSAAASSSSASSSSSSSAASPAVAAPGAGGRAFVADPSPPGPNLRPKFPAFLVSMATGEEPPTARVQRVASLNAMAKVHILYENESRPAIIEADDAPEDCKALVPLRVDLPPPPSPSSSSSSSSSPPPASPPPPPQPAAGTKRRRKPMARKVIKRKRDVLDADVEIIDTRQCRRMASLNAQAIMAASYSRERTSRSKFDKESPSSSSSSSTSSSSAASCELKVVHHHHQQEIVVCSVQTKTVHKTVQEKADAPVVVPGSSKGLVPLGEVSRRPRKVDVKAAVVAADAAAAGSSSSSVAVSEYREVVRINTTKEMAVKDELQEKEVTHLYHYHTKATCLQMQTTYSGRPPSPVPPPHPAVLGPPPQAPPGYYGGPPYPPALPGAPMAAATAAALMPPPQAGAGSTSAPGYSVNHVMPMSGAPVHRHYGSAFTVPHYGHGVPYPQAEYVPGYYQPAGPLIQPPPHDQCLIHKPVPYHPQHRPAPVAPPPGGGFATHCPSNLCPPPPHCYAEHLPCSSPPQGAGPSVGPAPAPQGYPSHYRPGPYHPQPPFQPSPGASTSGAPPPVSSAPPLAPPPSTTDSSFQMSATGSAAAVPKSEPVTPPETKSPSQGNEFSDASKAAAGKDGDGNGATRTTPFQPEAQLSVAEPLVLAKKAPRPPLTNKSGTTTLSPETDVLAGEPVVLARKGPRGAGEKQARAASTEDRGAEKKSLSTKGVKRSLLKANETEKVCLPAAKNGLKKSLPNNVSAVRLVERKKPRLSDPEVVPSVTEKVSATCAEKVSPATSSVPAPHLGNKKTVDAAIEGDKGASEQAVVGVQVPSKVARKENGSASQPAAAKKVPQSSTVAAVVVKSAASLQTSTKSPVVVLPPKLLLSKRLPRRKFAHGWSWDGEPFQRVVVMNNEDSPRHRLCFPAMRHVEGDVIRVRDCVLLRSGPRKTDLPFVAKVSALWEGAEDGEMMMSLLWYYRPEHTDQGRKAHHMEDEIFASKHRDANSVACIEDKCYVLTFAEYCRYRARAKMLEEGLRPPMAVVPDQEGGYPRRDRLPPGRMDPQMVFFCRRVYDFRQKRILKNPS